MQTPTNFPFNGPPVVQRLVTKDEILAEVRKRVNSSYMPSATGETLYNSKPEYLTGAHLSDFVIAVIKCGITGCYQRTDYWGYSVDGVLLAVHLEHWTILIDLATDMITVADNQTCEQWAWLDGYEMAIDRFALQEQLNLI